jgi:hypothetical protein
MVYEYMSIANQKADKMSYKERYRVAASLLYMMDKYKSGYAGEMNGFPK